MTEAPGERESPPSQEWVHFRPTQMNRDMFFSLSMDKAKRLIEVLAPEIHLYACDDKLVVLDLAQKTVLYLLEFKSDVQDDLKVISGVRVWRNKSSKFTYGLASKLFFDFLFPLADKVVIDGYDHSYGKSFWELRIAEAMTRGLPVVVYGASEGVGRRLKNYDEFYDLGNSWWGVGGRPQVVRLAILQSQMVDCG